jgi:hypothetical protein
MDTAIIDSALNMMDRAGRRLSNSARNSEEHKFARELGVSASDARRELNRPQPESPLSGLDFDDGSVPDECYCDANNAPCTHCNS